MTAHAVRDLVDQVREEFAELFVVEALLDATAESCHLVVREVASPGRQLVAQVLSRSALRARGLDATLGSILERWKAFSHRGSIPLARSGASERLRWAAVRLPSGPTLADRLRERGALDRATSLQLVGALSEVLTAAHASGLSHGDLRASQVILRDDGRPLLHGFGVAAAVEALAGIPMAPGSPTGDLERLARLYIACRLGLPSVVDEDVEPPSDARFTAAEQDAIARALGRGPEERFASVSEFFSAMRASPGATPRATPSPVQQPLLFIDAPRHTSAAWRVGLVASLVLLGAMPAQRLWTVDSRTSPILPVRQATVERPLVSAVPPTAPDPLPTLESLPSADTTTREPSRPPAPPVRRAPVRAPAARAPAPRREAPVAPVPAGPVVVETPVPAELGVSAQPWGHLYVDGRYIGDTPVAAVPLEAGAHVVRVVRPGFRPVERSLVVRAGERVRLTDLRLVRVDP